MKFTMLELKVWNFNGYDVYIFNGLNRQAIEAFWKRATYTSDDECVETAVLFNGCTGEELKRADIDMVEVQKMENKGLMKCVKTVEYSFI